MSCVPATKTVRLTLDATAIERFVSHVSSWLDRVASSAGLSDDVADQIRDDLASLLSDERSVAIHGAAANAGEWRVVVEFSLWVTELFARAVRAFDAEGFVGWRHVFESLSVGVDRHSQTTTGRDSTYSGEREAGDAFRSYADAVKRERR